MIEIPSKAIKKIKNDVHRDIVASNLIAYGFFPQTSEGINQAKKFVAGLNEWIATTDLPNYYDDIESDLLTHRETAGIRNIRMILEQFYFGGGAESVSEDIPVEIQVVEVEQTTPDEPIVVNIEAPFEPPLRSPKRLKLPRVKNTIRKKKANKKDTADRMADAFDRNLLGPLVDSILRPPAPDTLPTRKTRKAKEILTKKKTSFSSKNYNGIDDPYKANNFNAFVGMKIGAAFKRAAIARKEFIDAGGTAKELKERSFKDRFITKALAFEFGGDKLARTKGTFSSNPTPEMDPGISRGERFRASINSIMTPAPAPLNVGQNNVAPSSTPADAGVVFENSILDLNKSYSNILDGFNFSSEKQNVSVQKEREGSSLLDRLANEMAELLDAVKENSLTKKEKIKLKKELVFIEADAAQTEKDLAAEAKLEGMRDSASVNMYDPALGAGGGGLFQFAKNILFGGDDVDGGGPDGGPPGGGPDIGFDFDIDGGGRRRRRPGARRRLARRRFNRFRGGRPGGPVRPPGGGGRGFGRSIRGIGSRMKGAGGRVLGGIGSKFGIKIGSKLGKIGGRLIPGLGSIIGLGLAGEAFSRGDIFGGIMGLGSAIPGPIGWAFLAAELLGEGAKYIGSITNKAYEERNDPNNVLENLGFSDELPQSVMPSDGSIPQVVQRDVPWWEKMSGGYGDWQWGTQKRSEGISPVKMAEGGSRSMVGEAGKELVGTESELESMANSMYDSDYKSGIRTILGVTKNLMTQSGIVGSAVRPYIDQYISPIAKWVGIDNFTFASDVGSGLGEIQSAAKKESSPEILQSIVDFFTQGLSEISGAKGKKGKGLGDTSIDPDTGGGQGRTTANAVYKYLLSKGMSDEHARGIVVNISRESGFRMGARSPGGDFIGLFQWDSVSRGPAMIQAVPDWETNWKGQIDYALAEDYGPDYLSKSFSSGGEAAYDWMANWERPAEWVMQKYTPETYDSMLDKMNLSTTDVEPDAPPIDINSPPNQNNNGRSLSLNDPYQPSRNPLSSPTPFAASGLTLQTPSYAPPAQPLHPLLVPMGQVLGPKPNAQRGASPAEIVDYERREKELVTNTMMRLILENQ